MTDPFNVIHRNGMELPRHSEIVWNKIDNKAELFAHEIITILPPFDFYKGDSYKLLLNDKTYQEYLEIIMKPMDLMKQKIQTAAYYEARSNYIRAWEIYEFLVMHKPWIAEIYLRLANIFHLAGNKDDEGKVLDFAISHLSHVKVEMTDYVLQLGKQYDSLEFVNRKITNDQKIVYFNDLFILYNPYPEIELMKKQKGTLE